MKTPQVLIMRSSPPEPVNILDVHDKLTKFESLSRVLPRNSLYVVFVLAMVLPPEKSYLFLLAFISFTGWAISQWANRERQYYNNKLIEKVRIESARSQLERLV
jgi:hypothetical protein